MEVLQVTFRNMRSSPKVEEWVREEAKKLETFYSQITGCHVTLEIPHHHHVNGSPYHVRVDLTLPGGEVVVKRQASLRDRVRVRGASGISKKLELDGPHKSLRMAIDDAFRAAARRLQDYGRRQRGDVKSHQPRSRTRIAQAIGV